MITPADLWNHDPTPDWRLLFRFSPSLCVRSPSLFPGLASPCRLFPVRHRPRPAPQCVVTAATGRTCPSAAAAAADTDAPGTVPADPQRDREREREGGFG